jgi:radical SAM protein (TIGR01212 family)
VATQDLNEKPSHFAPHKRYYDFNTYLRQNFNDHKVYKVILDGGFTCPNRDGKVAKGGCIYCNANGSGSGKRRVPIKEQVHTGIAHVKEHYRAEKIMIYFQAFTNTYAPVEQLEEIYKEALCHEDIVAIAIGTRPDCIDREKLEMISQFSKDYEIWMEYGLETSHNETLERINRWDTWENFQKAVALTREYDMKICTHLIFGLPGETREQIIKTIDRVAYLKLDAVKIHNLYIEKGTALQKYYDEVGFELMSQEQYVDLVCECLVRLSEKTVIERLTGDPIMKNFYLPEWSRNKQRLVNTIERALEERGIWQGCALSKAVIARDSKESRSL